MGYHGGKDAAYKKIVQDAFASGSCRVLVSTKAFGMGIDIDDIDAVYHYAPTGNLSDYIQEIGRGGRKRGLGAKACIDFFMQDVRYSETLYALSKFSQWQLKEIMAKLYEVYASAPQKDRSQNFLVSPNTFSYLFTNEKDEDRKTNRVKSALMMISRDLEDKFNFPVIVVRPKVSYTKQLFALSRLPNVALLRPTVSICERLARPIHVTRIARDSMPSRSRTWVQSMSSTLVTCGPTSLAT